MPELCRSLFADKAECAIVSTRTALHDKKVMPDCLPKAPKSMACKFNVLIVFCLEFLQDIYGMHTPLSESIRATQRMPKPGGELEAGAPAAQIRGLVHRRHHDEFAEVAVDRHHEAELLVLGAGAWRRRFDHARARSSRLRAARRLRTWERGGGQVFWAHGGGRPPGGERSPE